MAQKRSSIKLIGHRMEGRVKIVKKGLSVLLAVGLLPLSAAAADDPIVARVNGVAIMQSDLDFAASELAGRLANYSPQDRKKLLVGYVIEIELMAGSAMKNNLDKKEDSPRLLKGLTSSI